MIGWVQPEGTVYAVGLVARGKLHPMGFQPLLYSRGLGDSRGSSRPEHAVMHDGIAEIILAELVIAR